jgi:hypothetical protein
MRVVFLLFTLIFGLVVLSCSNDGSADSLKAKELDLKKRELEVQRKERDQQKKSDSGEKKQIESLKWDSYSNGRFEFCVEYPTNFLRAQGESENNDGNVFATANGSSEMRASGMYNVLDEPITEAFKSASAKNVYYDTDHRITYKAQKGNWFVISGMYFESIFYVKTLLIEDTFYTVYFEYHPSESAQFDEIIDRVTKDFPGC